MFLGQYLSFFYAFFTTWCMKPLIKHFPSPCTFVPDSHHLAVVP